MDRANLANIRKLVKGKDNHRAKVMLWGEYAGAGSRAEIVDDPYYGGDGGFRKAFEQCTRFTGNFLEEVVPGVGGSE